VKKKLLVLVAMLLCVVTVLASCASSMKFEKIVGDGTYNDENPTLTTIAKLDVKGEIELEDSEGDLVIFKETSEETGLSTYTVYNVALGKNVWTGTETKTESGENYTRVRYEVSLLEQWGTTILSVMTMNLTATKTEDDYDYDTKIDVKAMAADGTEFLSITDVKESQMMNSWFLEDLLCLDGKVYRIADDGTVALAFEWSALRGEPDEDLWKLGNFYFEGDDDYIDIYDASLNLIGTYYLPSYAEEGDWYVLSNGNILIQYSVMQDIMAEDYDYIESTDKFNLHSFLFNAETGKLKELDLDFVVEDVWSYDADDEDWYFNEKIENVAWVSYIVDQRIDTSDAAIKMVALSNNGKDAGAIDNLIPNMDCEGLWHVATNRWIASNMAGQDFLLNEKGEILGEVSGIDWDEANANFFVLNGKIYDWDLNVKLDLAEQKCDDYEILNHSVLFETEDGEQKLYVNGEVKTLIDKATAEAGKRDLEILSDDLYVIIDTATEGKTKYEFYNDAGTLLTAIDNAIFAPDCLIYEADSNNAVVIAGMSVPAEGEAAKVVYYRVG
jgi:hypothetical protein